MKFKIVNKAINNLIVERAQYKQLSEEYKKILKFILNKIYNIGAPLNDNILKYNNKQLKIFSDIAEEIKKVI